MEKIKIALVGNPNSGKTTLFNRLTGSNQYVGNWPGVTVEKKEGKLKGHKDVTIVDLPGIYSLSPYTLEEVVSRNFVVDEKPDVILNIIDGTNLERNLYLTSQLVDFNIPMLIAVNMLDVMEKEGYKLDAEKLEEELGCKVIPISALNGKNCLEAANKAAELVKAKGPKANRFSPSVEKALEKMEALLPTNTQHDKRWYSIKLFEKDQKVIEKLDLTDKLGQIEKIAEEVEKEFDDDSESIITSERYEFISSIVPKFYTKKKAELTTSDKIDKIVTNRILALPIFVIIMTIVYYVSISTVGTGATDWVNDGVFGDGFFLFGRGREAFEESMGEYDKARVMVEAFEAAKDEQKLDDKEAEKLVAKAEILDDEGEVEEEIDVDYKTYLESQKVEEPDPDNFGTWIRSIPDLVGETLDNMGTSDTLKALILDGIIAGVGAVLGFVPQMFVLYLFLAFLEGCGYMARIAFIMDRIFRKFGLSGKSFIPMLIGTGCSVPAVMSSRTIESDKDRKMTIITTSFIPCGAKLPIIALIAGAMFDGAGWVASSAYFLGVVAIIVSGIILKKTKMFSGDPVPFVMELPSYHMPTISYVLKSAWERGWSFIKKAGTIILLATILVWFTSNYGFGEDGFGEVDMEESLLAVCGNAVAWIFAPLGFGNWKAAVATVTGLIAKENVVGTFGVLYGGFEEVAENGWQVWNNLREAYTPLASYSFLVFNLICAPCFAAIGAIRREMNNAKWTWFAILYQTVFAYVLALITYQIGGLILGQLSFSVFTVLAIILALGLLYLLVRPQRKGISNK